MTPSSLCSARVHRCRRLLDLDADPRAIDEALAADPLLAPLVDEVPGIRLPGQVDGFEMVLRAIVGQQVSVAGARTILGRIARDTGVDYSILAGRIDRIRDEPYGQLLVTLVGGDVAEARARLSAAGVRVEEA